MILTNRLTPEEREVHIWLDDVDRKWRAETSIGKYITKFKKAGWKETSCISYSNGQPAIVKFEAPERSITIRKTTKKVMSKENTQALSNHMCKLASKSKS